MARRRAADPGAGAPRAAFGPGAHRYESFSLRFEAAREDSLLHIKATSFWTGEERDVGVLDLETELLAGMRRSRSLGAHRDLGGGHGAPAPAPEEIGQQLFETLFTGNILRSYDTSRGAVLASQGGEDSEESRRGLRVELHFDPRHPRLLELSTIPWELLYDAKDRRFLSLDVKSPVVRSLELPAGRYGGVYRPPLRKVLVMLASPKGMVPLNTEREAEHLKRAWKGLYDVEITVLPHATVRDVQAKVAGTAYEIVHFVGHGDTDGGGGESFLFFEKDNGHPEPVSGRRLAAILQAVKQPRLVFLNACHSGSTTDPEQVSAPLSGVAVGLLMEGIPAVVAMQKAISDSSAIEFSRAVYEQLSHGRCLEEAVTFGRLTLRDHQPDAPEWATPVLFMRAAAGGPLFGLRPSQEPRPSDRELLRTTGDASPAPRRTPEPPPGPAAADGPDTSTEPKRLKTLQKDIYRAWDDLGLDMSSDYESLNAETQFHIQSELIKRLAGLSAPPHLLLDQDHLNLRFQAKALLDPHLFDGGRGHGELHRKSAIYSSHSVVQIPEVTLANDPGELRYGAGVRPEEIQLLLEHRPLVEQGKMTVIPNRVQKKRDGLAAIFSIDRLETVGVDMHDEWARKQFSRRSRAFGTFVVRMPHGDGLHLDDAFEIEEKYAEEYAAFQRRLREILDYKHVGSAASDVLALKKAIAQVDEMVQSLDARYEAIRFRDAAARPGGAAVALQIKGPDGANIDALEAAFKESSMSKCLEYFDRPEALPAEIRQSDFFIPWLIYHRGG